VIIIRFAEIYRRQIRTAVDLLPRLIATYPPNEHQHLQKLINLLELCLKLANTRREELAQHLSTFCLTEWKSDISYNIPFMWVLIDNFGIANRILGTSDFHGTEFFRFLARFLVSKEIEVNFFQLIKNKTSTYDETWENLQQVCNELPPLSEEELRALNVIYKLINEIGVQN